MRGEGEKEERGRRRREGGRRRGGGEEKKEREEKKRFNLVFFYIFFIHTFRKFLEFWKFRNLRSEKSSKKLTKKIAFFQFLFFLKVLNYNFTTLVATPHSSLGARRTELSKSLTNPKNWKKSLFLGGRPNFAIKILAPARRPRGRGAPTAPQGKFLKYGLFGTRNPFWEGVRRFRFWSILDVKNPQFWSIFEAILKF